MILITAPIGDDEPAGPAHGGADRAAIHRHERAVAALEMLAERRSGIDAAIVAAIAALALKKGDKVITSSGIWGTVTNLGKDTVTLQVSDNTKIKMQREFIARVRSDEDDKDA